MSVGIVSIVYGLAAGFLGYLLGQDRARAQREREERRTRWFRHFIEVRRAKW